MSPAPTAHLLDQKAMRRGPNEPSWPGRAQFVLSAGHSSLTPHVQSSPVGRLRPELGDLLALRRWVTHSGTARVRPHFRRRDHDGPLGQGLVSAVGFAARYERWLFDPDAPAGASLCDHVEHVIASDGDLEEGVTSETSSMTGHQQLGNRVVVNDAQQISIEDDADVAFTENVAEWYKAYGGQAQTIDWKAIEE